MEITVELFAELTIEVMCDNLVLKGVWSHVSDQLKRVFRILRVDFGILTVESWYLEANAKIVHEFLLVFGSSSCNLSLVKNAGSVQSCFHSIQLFAGHNILHGLNREIIITLLRSNLILFLLL